MRVMAIKAAFLDPEAAAITHAEGKMSGYAEVKDSDYDGLRAIAENLKLMSLLEVPIICIVIGEGASGGALGIGVGDRFLMLENSWYCVFPFD